MRQIWLRTNRRALLLAMLLPGAAFILGLALVMLPVDLLDGPWLRLVGGGLAAIAGLALLVLLAQLRQPRLAYDGRCLLVYLRSGGPIRVPIAVVEGFLLGQGPSGLAARRYATTETATVVIHLSERAAEFAYREVKLALGNWCNHYVTIRGTWCEPLSVELVNRLNELLAVAHQAARQEAAS